MKLTPTIFLLAIVVIVGVLLFVVFATRGPTTQPVLSPTPEAEIIPQFSNLVEVANQAATNSATISIASLADGGYVVIHQSTKEGTPSAVIGNTEYLEPGDYSNLEITLKKLVKAGEILFAMLHEDDGDKTYGFPNEDLPVKDEVGNIILQKFQIIK